jgi:hypothetical protein
MMGLRRGRSVTRAERSEKVRLARRANFVAIVYSRIATAGFLDLISLGRYHERVSMQMRAPLLSTMARVR